jgi:hypothetical protein
VPRATFWGRFRATRCGSCSCTWGRGRRAAPRFEPTIRNDHAVAAAARAWRSVSWRAVPWPGGTTAVGIGCGPPTGRPSLASHGPAYDPARSPRSPGTECLERGPWFGHRRSARCTQSPSPFCHRKPRKLQHSCQCLQQYRCRGWVAVSRLLSRDRGAASARGRRAVAIGPRPASPSQTDRLPKVRPPRRSGRLGLNGARMALSLANILGTSRESPLPTP